MTIKTIILIISFKIVLIFLIIKMKMVLQTLLLIVFGQTDVANLTKTNENAFAKAI